MVFQSSYHAQFWLIPQLLLIGKVRMDSSLVSTSVLSPPFCLEKKLPIKKLSIDPMDDFRISNSLLF